MPSKSPSSGPAKPRVAIVHDFLFTFGGAERLLQQIIATFPEAPVFTLFGDPALAKKYFPTTAVHYSYLQKSWLKRWPQLLVFTCPQAIESFDFTGYDVVISSSGAFSHGIITSEHTKHICYCHTPMRYAWDYHAQYAKDHGVSKGLRGFIYASAISKLRTWDFVSSLRPDVWLANSKNVQERITKYYHQPSTVLYPSVSILPDGGEKSPSDVPYLLTIARLSAYKRIDLMIEAARTLGHRLVVIGEGSDKSRLQSLVGDGDVQFLGRLSDEEAATWRRHAKAFLVAGDEDFGLTPVEAHSAGVPVVGVAVGGALETIIPGINGELAENDSVEAYAQAIDRAWTRNWDKEGIKKTTEPFRPETFSAALVKLVHD